VLPLITAAKATGITALFCLSDVLAAEAMLAAQSLGMRIPDNLSIVGCDDDPFVRFLRPQLTSIASPGIELGRLSGRLILEWTKQRPAVPQHILLPARLVKRDSTAALKS
jgi:LacI family transcriptional regulator